MTGDDLKSWRARYRLSQAEAANALGCSKGSIVNWEKPGAKIPRYIALACSAIAMNLPPYGERDGSAKD